MSDIFEKTGRELMREALLTSRDFLAEFFLLAANSGRLEDHGVMKSAAEYALDCYQLIRWISPNDLELEQPELLSFLAAPALAQWAELGALYRQGDMAGYLLRVGLLCAAVSVYAKKFGTEIFNGGN